ncbi:Csu type fimbrial protein [Nevskia soli]|uniref:Csu type fimbrial protein n=1 Tax=Nevskia soli TaxID=418856 RepID=UPI000691F21A|nr:spore coat U domain-containing protein [Nevskia soli]
MIKIRALPALSACAALAATFAAGVASFSAEAGTSPQSSTFLVSLTVHDDCTISAGNALNFGTATSSLINTAINGTTTFTVTCTNTTLYHMSLDAGSTTGSTVTNRLLLGGATGATVPYQLYTDNTYTAVWGDSTGGSIIDGHGTGQAQTITVNGKALSTGSMPAPDTYTSTETVTITF